MRRVLKLTGAGLIVLTFMVGSAGIAFACPYDKMPKHGDFARMNLEHKVEFKAEKILHAKAIAGLSDEQIAEVKQIKLEIQKEIIRHNSEIEVLKLDIWNEIYQDQPDFEKINQLIDQKYEHKKAKSKALAEAYVKLRQIPTQEQWEAIKGAMAGDASCGCGLKAKN